MADGVGRHHGLDLVVENQRLAVDIDHQYGVGDPDEYEDDTPPADWRAAFAVAVVWPIGFTSESGLMSIDTCPAVSDAMLTLAVAEYGKPDGPRTERHEPETPGGPPVWVVRQWRFTFEQGGVITLEQRFAPVSQECVVRVLYRSAS